MESKSVRVDEDKWDQVKRLGYNHSELHGIVMDMVLSSEVDSTSYDVQFNILKNRIIQQKKVITQTQYQLESEQSELAFLENKLRNMQDMYNEDRRILRLSRAIGRLNQIIVVSGYDASIIRLTAKKLIDESVKLNPAFDLEQHCRTLKNLI